MSHLFRDQSALFDSTALIDKIELATFSHTFAKHVLEGLNDVTLVATIGDIGGIAGQRNLLLGEDSLFWAGYGWLDFGRDILTYFCSEDQWIGF